MPKKLHVATSSENERGIGPGSPRFPSVHFAKNRLGRRVLRAQNKSPRVAQSGLGSEGILIYTLGGVFGGFQGKKTTTFWTPKSTLRTPSSHPLDGGVLDPNRPNPKRSGEVSVLYPAVTASSAIRTDSIPSSLVRTPWDPLRTPPGGPSWILWNLALLALWPIYRKPPKTPNRANPRG